MFKINYFSVYRELYGPVTGFGEGLDWSWFIYEVFLNLIFVGKFRVE